MAAELHILCAILSPFTSADRIQKLGNLLRDDVEFWEDLIALAHDHLLAPVLWAKICKRNLSDAVPIQIKDHLQIIHSQNKKRNQSLRQQAVEVIVNLNRHGIVPLLFKGAAHLFDHHPDDFGIRMMIDLDILIPSGQLKDSIKVMHGLGYSEVYDDSMDYHTHHHWAPLFRAGDYGCIELHREVLPANLNYILPKTMLSGSAKLCKIDNSSFYEPSLTHVVMLNILQSQLRGGYYHHRLLNLRYLNDLTLIACRHASEIDWDYIRYRFEQCGLKNVLQSYLIHANRLFYLTFPTGIEPDTLARLNHLISLAVFQSEMAEKIVRKIHAFSKDAICERYGCKDRPYLLMRNRMRFLGLTLKNALKL